MSVDSSFVRLMSWSCQHHLPPPHQQSIQLETCETNELIRFHIAPFSEEQITYGLITFRTNHWYLFFNPEFENDQVSTTIDMISSVWFTMKDFSSWWTDIHRWIIQREHEIESFRWLKLQNNECTLQFRLKSGVYWSSTTHIDSGTLDHSVEAKPCLDKNQIIAQLCIPDQWWEIFRTVHRHVYKEKLDLWPNVILSIKQGQCFMVIDTWQYLLNDHVDTNICQSWTLTSKHIHQFVEFVMQQTRPCVKAKLLSNGLLEFYMGHLILFSGTN